MNLVLCMLALLWPVMAQAEGLDSPRGQGWTLSAVLAQVDVGNRDVLAARRALDGAKADQLSASVTPPAQFSLLSQSIDTQNLGHGGLWNRPIDTIARIDKTLERGGKASLRERAAQAGETAAQHDVADVARAQRLAAIQAYWGLKLAQEQCLLSERNEQVAQESSRAAKLRLAQGDLSRLEATRLAVEADRAANERAQARSQLMQAQLALAQVLGQVGNTAPRATDPWPSVPPAASPSMKAGDAALATRPDVQAAAQRVAQAQAVLDLAQSQRQADVTVSVQFEHNPSVANRLWGVGFSMPMGVDGRQDGPVTRALVALADAQAQLEKVKATAQAEQLLQRDALLNAQERVQRLDGQLLPQARDALQGAEYARQQGALSLQDVLDARRGLHAAELDAAMAHADLANAWSTLSLVLDANVVTP